ncbi:magnesium transporter CorA family protein [Frigidibacter sp. MR17.14]|uniref:magnesium transporter CorA family protein n=1 Tax=Frigidibacter sp. MR17.14 TaxID=3126509 RepID=UPI003012CB8C
MMFAYVRGPKGLTPLPQGAPLEEALWIDLYRPQPEQVRAVEALGLEVPTLADMEEIEISNRLYREDGVDYLTVVLTGADLEKRQTSGPVTFILTQNRLVTVRHHAPRPFETFPERAGRSTAGCASPHRVFLGLIEECVARAADILEGAGRGLDQVSVTVLGNEGGRAKHLQKALADIARLGETVGRVRLALLTFERALSFFGALDHAQGLEVRGLVKAEMRDIQALAVHADFLAGRVSFAVDATLGMINLEQNMTVRILSVVAALFLPPTLIASVYGMNFTNMPELTQPWGYPLALALMAGSVGATWIFFKIKHWL